MANEIKEILEALKPHNDIVKEYPLTLSIEEQKLLLDYITNLQEEKDNLKKQYAKEEKKLFHDNEILQQRIDKAIEWINNHIETYTKDRISIIDWDNFSDPRKLLDILRGDE
jgi:hypothetical protein